MFCDGLRVIAKKYRAGKEYSTRVWRRILQEGTKKLTRVGGETHNRGQSNAQREEGEMHNIWDRWKKVQYI